MDELNDAYLERHTADVDCFLYWDDPEIFRISIIDKYSNDVEVITANGKTALDYFYHPYATVLA